jgi:alkylation response protein AidB-like acyl-CoA dehydrogenase
MNFSFTAEQRAIAESVARFVERSYDWEARKRAIRMEGGRDPAHWATFAELGWLGAGLSEAAGGFGGGAVENAVIAQELGRKLVNEPFANHVAAINLIAESSEEIVSQWLEPMMMGQTRIAVALQEPEGRGDFSTLETAYEASASGWRLSGMKSVVEGAWDADYVLIPANGADGLAIFAVPTRSTNLTKRPYRLLDNRHVCDLALNQVHVPGEAMILAGSAAKAAVAKAVDEALVAMCAEALGTMEAALWDTRDYLKTRTQFGVPLATFQALQHRMADMLIDVEMTRSLLFHALGAVRGDAATRAAAASALKAQTVTAGAKVSGEAIQMHGGIGVTEELAISHYYRRLYVVGRLLGGEITHLDRFAAALDAA